MNILCQGRLAACMYAFNLFDIYMYDMRLLNLRSIYSASYLLVYQVISKFSHTLPLFIRILKNYNLFEA